MYSRNGSRKDDQTGAGFVIYKHNKEIMSGQHRLPDHATVFQGEVTAIRVAAEAALSLQQNNLRFVKIFVDSQAAILAVANPIIKSKSVAMAVDALNALSATATSVTICWIPAHKGHFGNSRADDLAKAGAEFTRRGDFINVEQPAAVLKRSIRMGAHRDWNAQWQQDPQYVHSKHFYSGPDKQKAKFVYKLARLELGRFVRLITGHNNLNGFQTRIGLWNDRNCRFCKEAEETYLHFVTSCPSFWQSRIDFFKDKLPTNDMSWSVRDLLDFSYIPSINAAFEGTWAHGDPLGIHDLDDNSRDGDSSFEDA